MRSTDTQSDRKAWLVIVALIGLSLLIEGTTEQMEILRHGASEPAAVASEWLYEITSHLALIPAAMTVPLWLRYYPLSLSNVRQRIPIYLLGFAAFTILHILLMVGLRHLFWGLIRDGHYHFGLLSIEPWAYEIRKDFFTYLLVLSTFLTARHIGALKEELQAARQDAKQTGRLTLKSGGRTIALTADEIIYAKSSGNYVEIHTQDGMHFVRITLSELQLLMREAEADPIRLHRSYLTRRENLREYDATEARLTNGVRLPIGRAYKSVLAA